MRTNNTDHAESWSTIAEAWSRIDENDPLYESVDVAACRAEDDTHYVEILLKEPLMASCHDVDPPRDEASCTYSASDARTIAAALLEAADQVDAMEAS
jgi:hypothetical protein